MVIKSKKILIIEDDPWIVRPMKFLFGEAKFEVAIAVNAEDGLKAAEKDRPDLILLDILLPRTDGFAVLEALKKNPETRTVPVFIVSNLSGDADIRRGMELGAAKFFIKTNSSLRGVVEEAVELLRRGK